MQISKSFKFRCITTPEQDTLFSQWAGSCRFIYNWGLAERKQAWEKDNQHLSYAFQTSFLKEVYLKFNS